jgi:anti-sigma factor RsiW
MMTPAGGHDEVEQLLGAYALDALESADTEQVERHIRVCPVCRAELAQHREVTGLFSEVGRDRRAAPGQRVHC